MATGGIKVHVYGDYDDKDINKAIRDLKSLQTQADPTTKAAGGVTTALKGMAIAAAGAISIGAVTDYLRDAATAAMEDEKSMVALAKAMENVNQGFANTSTEEFVNQTMLATGVADDLIRNGLSRLITATGDAAQAQDLLTTALDISAATGRDVVSVSQALARASTGQVSALTRLGIPLDQNIVKSKDFAAALDVLNDRFGGQAAAAAETYAGKLSRLQVAAGEAQETIGYALLNAIDDVGNAFGGVGGATAVLQGFADKVADNIDILGRFATQLAEISRIGSSDGGQGPFGSLFSALTMTGPEIIDQAINRMDYAINYALGNAEAAEAAYNRINGIVNDGATLFAPLIRLRDIAVQTLGEQEAAAQDFEDAIAAVRDEVRDLQGTLSNNQSLDDFAASLLELDTTLEGNKRTFKGMSASALENRDTLRTAFTDAAGVVQGFVEEGRISEAEFAGVFAGTGKKIVDDLVAQGFKRKDIKAFLQREGLWTPELAAIFSKENNAVPLGEAEALGYDLASGISTGVSLAAPRVKTAISGTVLSAIQAGKNAAKIKSPSQATRDEIGIPLVEGIIVGLDSKKDALKAKATETAQGIIDAAKGIVDGWDAELDRLQGVYDEALTKFNSFKNGITADIFGRLDLDSAITEAEKTGTGIVSALTNQASGIGTFAQNMIDLTKTNLSKAAWQAVASLSAERGTELSAQMLGAQGQTIIDGVNKIYGDVDAMATAVGLLAAQKWYGEGVAQAQATYDGFKDNFGEGGPARKALENLMDRLSKAMNRTATITVKTVYEAAGIDGKRAAGGPVSANKAYLVGERGPEVLVMGSQSGTIIPNGDLPMASGGVRGGDGASMSAPVVVNVTAGMGTDGAEVGRQVVEALKAYERRNGAVYAKA